MKISNRVTYRKCRETQAVDPSRRNAIGTIKGLDNVDSVWIAQVEWDWGPGVRTWVNCELLETVEEPKP